MAVEFSRNVTAIFIPPGDDVAPRGEDVVGNPLDKVGTVLHLKGLHLFLDFLHGHLTTGDGSDLQAENSSLTMSGCTRGEVATVPGFGGGHHVLDIKHLSSEL